MPPQNFSGADFRLQSATPIGLATLRVRFTQDPKSYDANNVDDALNIDNYTLIGPTANYVISAGTIAGDAQAIDLYLAAPLELGEWTIAAANIEAENGDSLEPPLSLTFTVTSVPVASPVSGGAINDDVFNVLRKFLNPSLKGKGWDSLLSALATGDKTNWDNAKLASNQLNISTAKGLYLDRRAGDHGYKRPEAIAMPDDLFRELTIVSRASKLTQQALLDILEVFYGSDTVRAFSTTALAEPFLLEDQDDLQILIDEREQVNVVFKRGEFARIGQALAIEVAAAITRALRAAKSQAFAVVVKDEDTDQKHVRIYSGRSGISSTVRVLGGKAQARLVFPEAIFSQTTGPGAIWTTTVSPEPGRIRFDLTGTSTFDLTEVEAGDRVCIYGAEFDASGSQGSFDVKDVFVGYSGITLIQWFEIDNPDGVPGVYTQLRPESLAFFRPIRRNIYFQPRRVIVTQPEPEVEILVPATTQAVGRTAKSGAYGVVNEALSVSTLVRDSSGVVTVETDDPHGLEAGDVVLVDGVLPTDTVPPATSGVPSVDLFGDLASGTTDESVRSTWSETGTFKRTYHQAIRLEEGHIMFVGGQTQSASGFVFPDPDPIILSVDNVTTNPDGSRSIDYTWKQLTGLSVMGRQNFAMTRIKDDVYLLGGHNGVEVSPSGVFERISYRVFPPLEEAVFLTSPSTLAAANMIPLDQDTILISGGFAQWNSAEATVYKYDITTNSSMSVAPMNYARMHHESVFLTKGPHAGKAMIVGGRQPFSYKLDFKDLSYYPFDLFAFDVAPSGLSNHLTSVGADLTKVGRSGRCLRVGGATVVSSAGAAQDALNVAMGDDITVEGWITRGTGYIFSNGGTGVGYSQRVLLSLSVDPGTLKFVIKYHDNFTVLQTYTSTNPITAYMPAADSVTDPNFLHFAVRRKPIGSSTTLYLQINGEIVDSWNAPVIGSVTGSAALFYAGHDSTGVDANWSAAIDELRITVDRDDRDVRRHYEVQKGDVYWDRPTVSNIRLIGRCVASCEIYDSVLDQWLVTGTMAHARFGFGTVTIPDGRVIVIGGYGNRAGDFVDPEPLRSCEIYDPVTGLWASLPDMEVGRAFPVVAHISKLNSILVAGGRDETSCEYLDLKTFTWKHGIASLDANSPFPSPGPGQYRSAGGLLGDEFVISAGGSAFDLAGAFDVTNKRNFLLVPGVEQIWNGGLNTQAVVQETPDSTHFTYETPEFQTLSTNGSDEVKVTALKAQPSSIPGPFVFDPNNGLAITAIEAVVDADLDKERQYAALELRPTPIVDEEPALRFPDEEGYLVFNFGGETVGPVRYFGRLSETTLKLDYDFKFPHQVKGGTSVHYLAHRSPFQPSRTNLVGAFYATASAAGRRAASETIDASVAAGVRVKKTVLYPGDRGLGAEGSPDRSSYKLSDRVAVWGGDDLTEEIDNAREGKG